jgi:hypothetical protein
MPRNAASGHDLPPIFAANVAYVDGMGNGNDWRTTMTDKKNTAQGQKPQQQQQAASGQPGLQHQYAAIGIEAVAAAVRYSNPGKKAAEPTTAPRIDQRFEQAG